MKKFTEQLATDSALAEKVTQLQAQYLKSLAALAKEAGYDLSEEDFISKNEQLSEEELAGAAGGWSGDVHYDFAARRFAKDEGNICVFQYPSLKQHSSEE